MHRLQPPEERTMGKITLDPGTAELLSQTRGDAELVGPDGRPVGCFLSPGQYEAMRKAFVEWAFSQVTEEDCRRALANPKRHTMEEVLKLVEGE
jgi:hypothetical protein